MSATRVERSEGRHRLEPYMCPGNNYGPHDWVKTGDGAQSAEYFCCKHCKKTMVD